MEPRILNTDPFFNILAIVSVLLVLVTLRKDIAIYPALVKSLLKWKEPLHLEFNYRTSHDRNVCFAVLIPPLCLMLDRYGIAFPSFMAGIHPSLHLAATIVIFIIYILLRRLMKYVCRSRKTDRLAYEAVFMLFRTVFCIAVPACLATLGILLAAGVPALVIRTVILDELALFYILLLWRQGEILIHYRSVLTTILYLCALEILPLSFLVILWIV